MEVDVDRKGFLVALLDWVYHEFGEDLPSLVRKPVHLALAIAHKASPQQRDALKRATKADIKEVLLQSELATQYAVKGMIRVQAVDDAVRHLHKAFHEGIDAIREAVTEVRGDTTDILRELRVFHREFREQGGLSLPFALTPPRNIPPRNDMFVGRTRELGEIHDRLISQHEVGVTQQTAAHGHGGIGKTSVALEYAWLHLDDYPGGLFVLGCDTGLLLPAVVDLSAALGLEEQERPEQTAELVKMHLEAGPASLLILDNVRDGGQWADREWSKYLPAGNCRRLITTRARRLPGMERRMYPIERLPRDQGIALLAKHRVDAAGPRNEQLVGDIVDWFDGLAVALTVVGVYMSIHPELSWERYAESLERKGLGAVRATEKAVGPLPDYDKRVDAIFDETVAALAPEQQRALEYAALLPEDTVVRPWLCHLLEHDDEIDLPEAPPGYEDDPAEPVVASLVGLQLLRPSSERDPILTLHRVLRRWLNERLDDDHDKREGLLGRVASLGKERGKKSHEAITDQSIRWELAPLLNLSAELHVRGRLRDVVPRLPGVHVAEELCLPDVYVAEELYARGRLRDAAIVANWVHTPLEVLGRYVEDRESLSRFVERDMDALEEADPRGAASLLSNFATTLKDLGELPEARRRMERAIAIEETHSDADDPSVAITYSNLATILQDLGELPEARRRIERAIEIWKKHFDPDHPWLGIAYSNLAMILLDLGELVDARRRMERSTEIGEKHFDPDHPQLAICYCNLAMILLDLGELPEARRRTERVIEILEKHFDPDHPKLAISYHNLACIVLAEGDKAEACKLWRRAYAIYSKHFDDDHPNVRKTAEALERHCGGVRPGS